MNVETIHADIRADAIRLAGRPEDLAQRAAVYHHIWRHSGGNHVFPLLAAHGALWGAGHFRRGAILGHALSIGAADKARRRALIADFAYALKDINRRVCVETYTTYHLTRRLGEAAAPFVGDDTTALLCQAHEARRAGRRLHAADRRALFSRFFLWEQEEVVGPGLDVAVAELDWPVLRALALKPPIGFSYFGPTRWLWFRAFDEKAERIRKGLAAYDLAEARGLERVEHLLARYPRYPNEASVDPDTFFRGIAKRLGTMTHLCIA